MFPPHSTQLRDVWLSALQIEDHPAFSPEQNVGYTLSIDTSVELPEGDLPLAHLTIKVIWLDGAGETPGPFDLTATVTGCFEVEGGALDPEQLTLWIELNATHLLWTHARAYISAATSFTRHPPLTLFTVRVPDLSALDPETGEFGAVSSE